VYTTEVMGRHVAKMGIAGRRSSRSGTGWRRPSGRSPRKSPRGRATTGQPVHGVPYWL